MLRCRSTRAPQAGRYALIKMDFSTGAPIKIAFLIIGSVIWFALIVYILSLILPRFIDPNYKKKQNAWLKINWKWLVPTILIIVVVFNLSMSRLMKFHKVYKASVTVLNQSELAKETIGEPMNLGFFISGKVSWIGGGRIYYSISGPKAKGTLIAEGSIKRNKFEMNYTNIILDSGRKLKLIDNN